MFSQSHSTTMDYKNPHLTDLMIIHPNFCLLYAQTTNPNYEPKSWTLKTSNVPQELDCFLQLNCIPDS